MWKSDNQGIKEETFIPTGRRGRDGQPGWRGLAARWQLVDQGRKEAAGRPSQAADCRAGRARLQLAGKAAADGPGDRAHNPRVPVQGNKASNH